MKKAAYKEDALEAKLEQTPDVIEGGEDVGFMDPQGIAEVLGKVMNKVDNVAKEGYALSTELLKIMKGESEIAPDPKDWRFADSTWKENPVYHRWGQAYLAWSQAMNHLVDNAKLDWRNEERARFAINVLTSAVSPTNQIFGNPAAMKRAIDTGGLSLLNGMKNMIDDMRHNGGMPSQVDRTPFKKGENTAATPGAVVYRNDMCEVIQYAPQTDKVYSKPVVMIPPQINRYYFIDLAPGKSKVEHVVRKGINWFQISWKNPTVEEGSEWDLDKYISCVLEVIDVVREITGSDDVNIHGQCAGGITSCAMLGYLAAKGDTRVNAATLAVTMIDYSLRSMVGMFANKTMVNLSTTFSKKRGALEGRDLSQMFAFLRPNELVWNYWVNNYLMGKTPPPFDLLAWNSDSTRLAGGLHNDFMGMFIDNKLTKPGEVKVLGTPIDLMQSKHDKYIVAGKTDHLTFWKSCYRTSQIMGGESEFLLTPTGHIQSIVFPPGNPKAKYFTGPKPGANPDEWFAAAKVHEGGTWWDHWVEWIIPRSGSEKSAPKKLGSKKYPVIEPAPGQYITS